MASPNDDSLPHIINRTPEYEAFMEKLKNFHNDRGTVLDPEPKVGLIHLDLYRVFNHIISNGGYDKVSEEKLAWRRMAAELGLFSNNEASTAFALKEKFYKNLAAYEIKTIHGQEPPPRDILEDVTAKGAGLLTRTRENFRGKRDSNMAGNDSAASGDDGTPARERPAPDTISSARASRGLREAPTQRVIFQPDTGPSRASRQASAQHAATSSPQVTATASHDIQGPPPIHHGTRGPSIVHCPPKTENISTSVTTYQPRHSKPLQLRPVATPNNAPSEFPRSRISHRAITDRRQPMLPGTGFDGPNIYTRCLNALRSRIPTEQAFALNHLVKISFERGDKYKFDSFPGLAEALVEKGLEVGEIFYFVKWKLSWDSSDDSADIGVLDGNYGTPDILERISNLVEKPTPDIIQTEEYFDKMVLITEAILTIRNMVTLPGNAQNMSEFPPAKDLVCIILHLPAKDSLVEIKHMALDIAEQITSFMALEADDPLYKTLLAQMDSDDRGTILSALRALGRISMNLEATNLLSEVPGHILQRIASWLLLNDDELIDACLDFLYQYTAIVPNLDKLVRCTYLEGLVDQLVRLLAHGARKVQYEVILTPEQRLPSRDEVAPMPEDLLEEMLKLEEPDRVHQWVKSFFEEDGNSFVTQLAAWQAYQTAFAAPLKNIQQQMITPADFIRNSTAVYKGSNAQVLREPGDGQQKFIIHGIRTRPNPLSLEGREYGRCLWAADATRRNEKCGLFFLKAEQMWRHIMKAHLDAVDKGDEKFGNVEKTFVCTWGECNKHIKPTKMYLQEFARHVMTHVSAVTRASRGGGSGEGSARSRMRRWIVPAKTLRLTVEETMTVRDERNPQAPPQAAGIPLSALLVLRNIARNIVKTEAEEELVKQQEEREEKGGWNERLFRAHMPRFFELLTENKPMGTYVASMLDLIQVETETRQEDDK